MKKILIFSVGYYPNAIGGAEVALREITGRIPKESCRFDMITLRFNKALPRVERIGNITVHRIGFFPWLAKESDYAVQFPYNLNKYCMPLIAFFKAVSLHRKKRYDGVWAMMASYNSLAALCMKVFFPSIYFLLTLQEGERQEYIVKKMRPLWPLFRLLFKKANHVQVISKYLASFARTMGYTKKISIIPNGVDTSLFAYEPDMSKLPLRKRDDDIWLIHTGRLTKKNGLLDLVKALSMLPQNVSLLLVGKGELKDELIREAHNVSVFDRIHFIDHVEHDVLVTYIHESDIFIRPSLSEGFGNSFIEAMAVGIPVIGTTEGGIADFLVDGETGFVCEADSPKSIVREVHRILEHPEEVCDVVRNAQKMAIKKYDWRHIAAQMEKLFAAM